MYHASPVQIKQVTNDGRFGTGLFFGSSSNCGHGSFVYEIENSEDIKICTATHLRYEFCDSEPEVVAFAKKWEEIDIETAFDIITGKESAHNYIGVCGAWEAGWEAQKIALILAMRAGYEGVQLFDNGTVWLVDGHVAIKKWREI